MVGSVLFIVYGIMIHSYAVPITNAVALIVNTYRIFNLEEKLNGKDKYGEI